MKQRSDNGFGFFGIVAIAAVVLIVFLLLRSLVAGIVTPEQPSTFVSPTPIAGGASYVALGDSYSAGGGADRTPENLTMDRSVYDNSNKCARSKNSAQYIIAKDLRYNLTDASCGGAVVEHLLDKEQEGNPPQITAIKNDTALVTMTIGGNDTALLYMAIVCIQWGDCTPDSWVAKSIDDKIAALPAGLEKVYKQIIQKAPNTAIRHAGYPYILPKDGDPQGVCTFMTTGEQKLFNEKLLKTNNAIKQTIQNFASKTGKDAMYIDPLAANSPFMTRDNSGASRDGCSTSKQRYMNGPNDGWEGIWHPNIYGQQDYAKLYELSL